ncbi:WD40/YVTN repeat-like-containing domain [Lasallia pustulata]|uniref:WD40/YVTN repeat-like-containing domain n=1 Tax=Lasallia pustulata TaxID=136370 RepID=A0A1W5CYZ2_9LECA|nr:WD40/YVTN repeat-like-containing domain [Lasallia pustulata]
MGYQPVIDSYESFTGASWTSRREVLCWGAGAELNLRIRGMGDEVEMAWHEASIGRERLEKYDQHHHKIDWAVYKENYSQEGRDDITSVNLLRTSQRQEDSSEYVVVGRASGRLQCLRLLPEEHESEVVAGYVTDNRPVRGATVSPSMEPLLAACLTDGTVAIYPVTHNKAEIEPLGPSPTPLHIYQINQAGIHATPLRRFGTSDAGITVYGDTSAPASTTPSSSIYSLTALPHSSPAGGSPGDLLLSGWYDGCIRQHDTRAPNPTTALYADPIDGASPIYSLLALGRERFIAGGARHSILKIFDLRMPGGKAYYAADLEACSPPTHSNALCCDYHYQGRYDRRDWNIFLHPPGPGFDKLGYRSDDEWGSAKAVLSSDDHTDLLALTETTNKAHYSPGYSD